MTPRFLLDSMLGTLTRWLRISGYDSEYNHNSSDGELIQKAISEDRIILTKDRHLYRRSIKMGAQAFMIEGNSDVQNLASVTKRFDLELNPLNSRCPQCDSLLYETEKKCLLDKIPLLTFQSYSKFWVCKSCGKVYWQGSHWNSIMETIRKAKKLAYT